MNPACTLDVPSIHNCADDRSRRRQLGRTLVRKRLLTTTRLDSQATDYIYADHKYVDYSHCIFLNDNIVLAASPYGDFDIVKVPQPQCAWGTALSCGVQAVHSECLLLYEPLSKITSINDGHAFAVGMEYGDMRVFSTETGKQHIFQGNRLTLRRGNLGQKSWIQHGYSLPAPARRYLRSATYSLYDQLHKPSSSEYLDQIYEWKEKPFGWRVGNRAGAWDFWRPNANASAFRAIHIGSYDDHLTLRDSRQNTVSTRVVIDKSLCTTKAIMKSVCFASENIVVTAIEEAKESTCIRLLDLRMLGTRQFFLPTFPLNEIGETSELDSFFVSTTKGKLNAAQLEAFNGGLLYSRHFDCNSVEAMLLDPVTGKTLATIKFPSQMSRGLCTMASCSSQNWIATYGDAQEGIICLYDMQRAGCDSRKRKRDENIATGGTIQIRPGKDSLGNNARTSILNCLAFNEGGTRLVAGSADGILIWRAF